MVNRPISPHLQIYKPQLTSVLSITHRGTGIFLCLGILLLTIWLVCLALGEESYNIFYKYTTSWYGKLFLISFIFSLFYHLTNGIRHLFWDFGLGLDLSTTYKSGYVMLCISILLTLITLILGDVVTI